MSVNPESNFTESFTASVPLASELSPTTTAEGRCRKNILLPLPGGMKPGILLESLNPSVFHYARVAGSIIFVHLQPPTGARGNRLADKSKRFNHSAIQSVNPHE
jgi:hypothetical protein